MSAQSNSIASSFSASVIFSRGKSIDMADTFSSDHPRDQIGAWGKPGFVFAERGFATRNYSQERETLQSP
jgi:hypothetical protein